MKKRLNILAAAVILALSMASVAGLTYSGRQLVFDPEITPAPTQKTAAVTLPPNSTIRSDAPTPAAGYVLRVHQGVIWIFRASEPEIPLRSTGIPAASLRRADLALFEAGVTVHNERELAQLLEDFGS